MYRITKEVSIEASHCLSSMPEGHPCKRLHGHTYKVEVGLASEQLGVDGFVVDFGAISSIIRQYDHQYLGDDLVAFHSQCNPGDGVVAPLPVWQQGLIPAPLPATAEVFARVIADRVQVEILNPLNLHGHKSSFIYLEYVTVCETGSTTARFTP